MKSFDPLWEERMYSQNKQVNRYPFGELVPHVLRLYGRALKDGAKLKALELGCGTGPNLPFLAKEGFETHGIDGSASACKLARDFVASQGAKADIVVGDFVKLPYEDASFDLIIDRESVCHNRWAAILAVRDEVLRCLKPGGRLLAFSFSTEHSAPTAGGGEPIEPGTYANFKTGSFAAAGTTHFFTEQEMREGYLKGFELEFLFHHRNDFLHPERRNEYAEFIACGRKP